MITLKKEVIHQLNEHIAHLKNDTPSLGVETFSFSLEPIEISQLPLYIDESLYAFWRSKEADQEILGLGSLKTFKRLNEYPEMLKMVETNPSLTLMGGQRFSQDNNWSKEWLSFGEIFYFLPIIQIEKKNNQHQLKINFSTEIINDEDLKAEFIFKIERMLTWENRNYSPLQNEKSFEYPSKDDWEKGVTDCLNTLKGSEEKVVLARKVIQRNKGLIDPASLLNQVAHNSVDSFLFLLQIEKGKAFLSLTPERLFKIENKTLFTDALAGTRPRGEDLREDRGHAKDLLLSSKDLNEHRIVKDEIEEKLNTLCHDVEKTKCEGLLKLKYVQHLHSCYQGLLKDGFNVQNIIEHLHPTPAVGGRPWNLAKETISQIENFDRGFYAAPIGIINTNYCDFAVGIRSALIEEENLHLYSGAGIVKGSKGSEEWIETQNKLKNFPIQL